MPNVLCFFKCLLHICHRLFPKNIEIFFYKFILKSRHYLVLYSILKYLIKLKSEIMHEIALNK